MEFCLNQGYKGGKGMKVLITHEESQAVTIAFRDKGHVAYSNDLKPCSGNFPEWHIQDDCFRVLCSPEFTIGLEFLGAHCDCTYLTNAGVRWLASVNPREGYEWSDKYQIYINGDR